MNSIEFEFFIIHKTKRSCKDVLLPFLKFNLSASTTRSLSPIVFDYQFF